MHLVKFLLYGAIFSLAIGEFGHIPFGEVGSAFYIADIFLVLSYLCFAIWTLQTGYQVKIVKSLWYLVAFWIVCAISLGWSLTLFSLVEVASGSLYLLRFILYSGTLFLVYNLVESKVLELQQLIKVWVITGLIVAILGFIQLLIYPNLNDWYFDLTSFGFDPHQGRLVSTFLDPNFTGIFLTIIFGLVIWQMMQQKSFHRLSLFILSILLVAIVLTYSRTAYLMLSSLAIFLSIILGSTLSRHKKLYILGSIIVVGILVTSIFPRSIERIQGGLRIDASAKERFYSWQNGIELFLKSPVVGMGFNNLKTAKSENNLFQSYQLESSHAASGIDSSLLTVLVTTGIFGTFAFIWFWATQLKQLFENSLKSKILFCLFLALLLASFFVNSLFFVPVMLAVFSLLGATVRR